MQSPTLEALRVAHPPQMRWLRRIAFWWRYRRRELSQDELRLRFSAGDAPDCAACTENCCTAPNRVSLRLADIARLHDAGLGWAIDPKPRANRHDTYRAHPALRKIESRESFARFPVLRHTEDERCVFLDESDRCSIYPIRPLACRRFPLFLEENLRDVAWASICKFRRDDRTASASLLADVAANHNAKINDIHWLTTGRPTLRRLGLEDYLPRSFKDHLDAARQRKRSKSPKP